MLEQMLKQWSQIWTSAPMTTAPGTTEASRTLQKRWIEASTEALTKQREMIDSAYRAGIAMLEQTAQLSDAKSADDYRRGVERLWQKLLEVVRTQSEAQLQQTTKTSQVWLETPQKH